MAVLGAADDPYASVTLEASGEVRLSIRVPQRHGPGRGGAVRVLSEAAGCGALVYSRELRETRPAGSGFGAMPRETKFGSFGRRTIKNACGALETKFGKRLVFATLTLPGSTRAARDAVCKFSAKVVELLTKWIAYNVPGAQWCYVWERQRSGALHLHAAIGHESARALRPLERDFQRYAHRLWQTISRLSGVDCFERAAGGTWRGNIKVLRSNCVPVRKSVKRYMAKYLSKGVAGVPGGFPSRWWGCSKRLRAWIDELRQCTRRKTSCLASVARLSKTCIALATRLECKWFSFSIAYSPHSVTYLLYPAEPDCKRVFQVLSRCMALMAPPTPAPPVVADHSIPILTHWG